MERFSSKEMLEMSDDELLAEIKSTNNAIYLKILYQRFEGLVFGSCFSALKDFDAAEDASGNIWELILIKIKDHDINSLSSWIYALTRNFCTSILRARQKKQAILSFEENSSLEPCIDPEYFVHLENMEKGGAEATLIEAMQELPILQAASIKSFYFDKKSYSEISAELGVDISIVKSSLQNGKRTLWCAVEKYLKKNR